MNTTKYLLAKYIPDFTVRARSNIASSSWSLLALRRVFLCRDTLIAPEKWNGPLHSKLRDFRQCISAMDSYWAGCSRGNEAATFGRP